MSLQVIDLGCDNEVSIADDVLRDGIGVVTLTGSGSRLSISAGSVMTGASIKLGPKCTVTVDGARLAASEIFCASGATIVVGRNSAFTWRSQILAHEAATIRIGRDCLFANNSVVTVSDMHSILDLDTGSRLNPAADVTIADHVWIGLGCLVMKGVSIGEGAIIGAGSIVTKDVPANSLAAGNPVRVLRHRVTWAFDLVGCSDLAPFPNPMKDPEQ